MDFMKKLLLVDINDVYKKTFSGETFTNGDIIHTLVPYDEEYINEISVRCNFSISFIRKHSISINDEIYKTLILKDKKRKRQTKKDFLKQNYLEEWII
jgi:hypothetical protein